MLSLKINAYRYQDLDNDAKKEVIYWLDYNPQEYEKEDGTFGYSYYGDLGKDDEHIIIEMCDMNNYLFDKNGNPIHQLTL
jgi:hypothetical protein